MKRTALLAFMMITSAFFSAVLGQNVPPPVADNANIVDNNIKMRSVELERAKREAATAEAASFAPINTKMASKFPEIKEDFEGIQIAQTAIVTAYTKSKTIDYVLIETSAETIGKKAKRLDSNLFLPATGKKEEKSGKDDKEKEEKPKAMKDLIVELDNAIGDFLSSKMFGNLKVIEPEIAIKTRTDLLKIHDLSLKLANEARKMK